MEEARMDRGGGGEKVGMGEDGLDVDVGGGG